MEFYVLFKNWSWAGCKNISLLNKAFLGKCVGVLYGAWQHLEKNHCEKVWGGEGIGGQGWGGWPMGWVFGKSFVEYERTSLIELALRLAMGGDN